VFPQQRYVESIPEPPVAELQRAGWPVPRVREGVAQAENLRQLIRYLRNAVARFNIEFVGDTQNQLRFLRGLTEQFIELLLDEAARDDIATGDAIVSTDG
jgi:hypothetical protein